MSRQLLAFKRGPIVEIRLDDLRLEVKGNRVFLGPALDDTTLWLSWEEWHDLVRRVEHAMRWIEEHTPDDVTGRSFDLSP